MAQTLENLVVQVGGCGRYQTILICLSYLCVPTCTWCMLFMVFGAMEPDWWCESRDVKTSFMNTSGQNVSFLGRDKDDVSADLNYTDLGNYSMEENFKMCRKANLSQDVCDRIRFAEGANTVVSEFQLVCGLSWVPSVIISAQMVGVLIGSVIAGQMGDTIGRKKTLVTMIICQSVFCLVAAFSNSWQMFIALRVLIGIAAGGILSIIFVYPTEFIGIKWRAILGTIPVWGFGVCSFSLVVWVLRDWRHVHIATAVCTAATLPAWIFLPESMRWLSVKGHVNEAHRVMHKMAVWNRREVPDVLQMKESLSDSNKTRKYTYWHIFRGWKMAKVSFIVGYMWFACSLTYYGLSFGMQNLSGDFYVNLVLMAVVEIPANFLIFHLFNWFGRRWTCAGIFLVASLSSFAVVPVFFFAPYHLRGSCITGLAILARSALIFGWNAMTVFHAELYPTVVRNIGAGYSSTCARVGGILTPYIIIGGEDQIYIFYIIIGVITTLNFVSPLLLRETRGRPLEDELSRPRSISRRQQSQNAS